MMPGPLVSVVMPVFNAAEHLEEAVESILRQTIQGLEFIIIDDGSTDQSSEILDRYAAADHRISIIRQPNQGVAVALNRGLKLARGRYIARMDADDVSLPDRLEQQAGFMERHPEVGLCGTACRLFGDQVGVTRPRTESGEIKAWLIFGPCMAHPTVMMRSCVVREHELYYDRTFRRAEDYDLWFRFSLHCDLANIAEPLLLYRVSETQLTTARAHEIGEWSSLVCGKALGLIGIEPTDAQMRLHQSIHDGRFARSLEYLDAVEQWLGGIREANDARQAYDLAALASVLVDIWRAICLHACGLGSAVWTRYSRSPICADSPHRSATADARAFARAILSAKLDRSAAGRSLKQFIRGRSHGMRKHVCPTRL